MYQQAAMPSLNPESGSPLGGSSAIARVVREAVAAFASPEVSSRILRRALHAAHEYEVPADARRLDRFVGTYLGAAVEFVLSEDEADAVVAMLAPMLRFASQQADHESGGADPAAKTARPTAAAPPWIVASTDRAHVVALRAALGASGIVHEAPDVLTLLETFDSLTFAPIILLACMSPAVQPHTLATLAPELPVAPTVLLWGGGVATEHELHALASGHGRWLRCDAQVSVVDLPAHVDAGF